MKYMVLGAVEALALVILFDQGFGWPLWLCILAAIATVGLTWMIPFAFVMRQTQRDANRIFQQLDDLARFRDASSYQSEDKRY